MEALLLFAVAFGPLAFGTVEPWAAFILQAALLALFAWRVLSKRAWLAAPLYRTFLPAAAALGLLGLLQWLHPVSLQGPTPLLPFTASRLASAGFLLMWTGYLALLASAPQVLATAASLRRLVWAVFLLGVFVALAGVVWRASGNAWLYGLRSVPPGLNPFGPYYNSDNAACLMTMSLLTGCGLWLSRWTGRPSRAPGAAADLAATQALLLFLLAVVALGLWKTGSRGGILSLAAAGGLMALLSGRFLRGRARWGLAAGFALAAAGGAWFLARHPWWLGNPGGVPDASTAIRLSIYRGSARLLRDYPVFGVGQGAFPAAFPAYQESAVREFVDHAHGDWLELALEAGLLGLALFLAGLLALARRAWSLWGECRDPELRRLAGGVLAACLAFLLHGFVDFSFHVPGNAVVFLALLAWLGSAGFSSARGQAPRTMGPVPGALRGALSAACLLLVLAACRPAVSWWYVHRSGLDGGPELLREAVAWSPEPAALYRAGLSCLALAEKSGEKSEPLLREALLFAGRASREAPANPWYRRLEAEILSRLGRRADAAGLIGSK